MYLFPALLALTGTTWVYTVSDQFGGEGVVEEERGGGGGGGGLSKCQNLVTEEGILKRQRLRQPKR